jgi:hypothetical protein
MFGSSLSSFSLPHIEIFVKPSSDKFSLFTLQIFPQIFILTFKKPLHFSYSFFNQPHTMKFTPIIAALILAHCQSVEAAPASDHSPFDPQGNNVSTGSVLRNPDPRKIFMRPDPANPTSITSGQVASKMPEPAPIPFLVAPNRIIEPGPVVVTPTSTTKTHKAYTHNPYVVIEPPEPQRHKPTSSSQSKKLETR